MLKKKMSSFEKKNISDPLREMIEPLAQFLQKRAWRAGEKIKMDTNGKERNSPCEKNMGPKSTHR